jgi:hypothetical protein
MLLSFAAMNDVVASTVERLVLALVVRVGFLDAGEIEQHGHPWSLPFATTVSKKRGLGKGWRRPPRTFGRRGSYPVTLPPITAGIAGITAYIMVVPF